MAEHYMEAAGIGAYVCALREAERSGATIEKYARELRRFGVWLGGRAVTKETVIEYKAELAQRYAPASVNCMLAALNGYFTYCGWGECRVKPLRIQRALYRDAGREMSRAEYARLVAAAQAKRDERLALAIQALCSLGLRVGELRFLTVRAARQGRAEIRNKGKCRLLFLPRALCARLLAYCRARGIGEGPVFVTRSGRPLDRSNIWRMMKALCRAAKVAPQKVFPHNLRHLFARCFYKQQKDIEHLACILGHSNINTTRVYTHTSGAEYRRQMEKLALLL